MKFFLTRTKNLAVEYKYQSTETFIGYLFLSFLLTLLSIYIFRYFGIYLFMHSFNKHSNIRIYRPRSLQQQEANEGELTEAEKAMLVPHLFLSIICYQFPNIFMSHFYFRFILFMDRFQ